MVEHYVDIVGVAGSSPVLSTTKVGLQKQSDFFIAQNAVAKPCLVIKTTIKNKNRIKNHG